VLFRSSTTTTTNINVSDLQEQIASISAQIGKFGTIDDLSKRVSLVEKELASSVSSDQAATVSGQFDKLTVLGKTLLSDVGITGKVTMGLLSLDGMSTDATPAAAINTLSGPLKLQSLGLNGIDILNGKITIDTNGNMKVNAEITAKKYNVDTSDVLSASVGEAIIPIGSTSATINTTALTGSSKIFATPKKLPVPVSTDVKGNGTFEIDIKEPLNEDVKVDWWIIN